MEKLYSFIDWSINFVANYIQNNFLINFIMIEKIPLKMIHYEFDLNNQKIEKN